MIRSIVAPVRNRLNFRRWPLVRKLLPLFVMSVVLFGLLAFLDARLVRLSTIPHLSVLLAVSLLFGALLAWILEKKLFTESTLTVRSLLLLGLVVIGIGVFIFISPRIGRAGSAPLYVWVFVPSLLLVAFPWFFWRAVTALANVPQLRFRPFVFESLKDVIAAIRFAEDETRGIRWVFEGDFYEMDPSGNYSFRTFLPKDARELPLWQLFKGVFSLHNITECPQQPIDLRAGQAFYGWEFYHYPFWWWPLRKRFLNPYQTVKKCGVRYRMITKEERARSVVKLVPRFKAGTIYVIRSTQES